MRGYCFIIISSLLVFAGCNYDIRKNGADSPGGQGKALTAATVVDWNFIHDFVTVSCRDCHSAGDEDPSLDTYQAFTDQVVLARVLEKTDANKMPPGKKGYAPLTSCQKAILHKWAELGVPEKGGTFLVATLPECQGVISADPTDVESDDQ